MMPSLTSNVAPERLMLGASTLMPSRCAFGAKFRQLVGVVEVERHRRREEFDGG